MFLNTDFTISLLQDLYRCLKDNQYNFQTFEGYLSNPLPGKVVVLRHDVDARKEHSLRFAKIQNKLNIKGTYYFRTVPASFDIKIIEQIAELGHEIGYHYETMDTSRGNPDLAYGEFCRNLDIFRKIAPIKTVCMHGSPLSKFDNRDIWRKYNYRSLNIIGEPYFDLDFNSTFYITDTGRRWDGIEVSIRDKPMHGKIESDNLFLKKSYHSTYDIIAGIKNNSFPERAMFTFHPQRWTDDNILWLQELVLQNVKNQVKKLLVKN